MTCVRVSREYLRIIKNKITVAKKNKELLRNKIHSFEMIATQYGSTIKFLKNNINSELHKGYMQIMKAKFFKVDLSYFVILRMKSAEIVLESTTENTMGVTVPKFNYRKEDNKNTKYYGLTSGKLFIFKAKQLFENVLVFLIRLASHHIQINLIEDTIKDLKRRAGIFEHVLIPKYENMLQYIEYELEERDREDYFRFKKVKLVKGKSTRNFQKEYYEKN